MKTLAGAAGERKGGGGEGRRRRKGRRRRGGENMQDAGKECQKAKGPRESGSEKRGSRASPATSTLPSSLRETRVVGDRAAPQRSVQSRRGWRWEGVPGRPGTRGHISLPILSSGLPPHPKFAFHLNPRLGLSEAAGSRRRLSSRPPCTHFGSSAISWASPSACVS